MDSTYGILFLGTPHQGADVTLGQIAVRIASIGMQTTTRHLSLLETNSEWLEQLQATYLPISGRFKTAFFYEEYPIAVPGLGNIHVSFHAPNGCFNRFHLTGEGGSPSLGVRSWS